MVSRWEKREIAPNCGSSSAKIPCSNKHPGLQVRCTEANRFLCSFWGTGAMRAFKSSETLDSM